MLTPVGMSKIESFRDLLVWQKSMNLAERCYRISKRFPREDQLVLGYESRKSCVSVPSNIAEGFGRHYTPDSWIGRIARADKILTTHRSASIYSLTPDDLPLRQPFPLPPPP